MVEKKIRKELPLGARVIEKEFSGITKTLYFLIGLGVTLMYVFEKTH